MQTNNVPGIKLAEAAATLSPMPPTQHPSTLGATVSRSVLRPDLLPIANNLVAQIWDCRVNALDWLISEAVTLKEFRDQLPVDDFYTIIRSGHVPIKVRTAQSLIRIARNKTVR